MVFVVEPAMLVRLTNVRAPTASEKVLELSSPVRRDNSGISLANNGLNSAKKKRLPNFIYTDLKVLLKQAGTYIALNACINASYSTSVRKYHISAIADNFKR